MLSLREGDVFASDFRIVRELGRGGMGAVYVVEQLSTGKQRALKLMNPNLLDDDKSRERFVLEARVGARVQSDHVVEVIAAGVEQGRLPWLAMELLEGETLDAAVRQGPLSRDLARVVFQQLFHALGAAHHAGLVHRDVKPDNVFLAASRSPGMVVNVKLLDFGIAKLIQPTVDAASKTAAVGTPLFMAPEQTRSGPIDARADVWALGLLVFHALSGLHYWRTAQVPGAPLTGLLMEVIADPLEPASVRAAEYGAGLPPGFDAWFERCVSRSLEQRFDDATAAWNGLARVFEGEAPHPFAETLPATHPVPPEEVPVAQTRSPVRSEPAASTPEPTRPAASAASAPPASLRLPWLIAGGAVFGLVAVALALVWTQRNPEPNVRAEVERAASAESPTPGPSAGVLVPLAPSGAPSPADTLAAGDSVADGAPGPVAAADVPETHAADEPSDDAPAVGRGTTTEPAASARRPAPRSPQDRRTIAIFERLSNQGCQAWLARNQQERQVVRVTQRLDRSGSIDGWTVHPNNRDLRECLARSGANAPWNGTGQAREVRFRFVLRRSY